MIFPLYLILNKSVQIGVVGVKFQHARLNIVRHFPFFLVIIQTFFQCFRKKPVKKNVDRFALISTPDRFFIASNNSRSNEMPAVVVYLIPAFGGSVRKCGRIVEKGERATVHIVNGYQCSGVHGRFLPALRHY